MNRTALEDRALRHFDDLRGRGELLWTDTDPIVLKDSPFDVSQLRHRHTHISSIANKM